MGERITADENNAEDPAPGTFGVWRLVTPHGRTQMIK